MQFVSSVRTAVPVLALSAVALGSILAGAATATATATGASAGSAPARVAAAPAQRTVTATLITRPGHTLASGTTVSAAEIFGQRVFVGAKRGFALVDTGQAQYPAGTTDGGGTWKTDGPALHLNAAQAPLAVVDICAAGRRTVFAWGTGQVIDTTSNGGKRWYRALFQGLPVAVVKNPQGHLVAFVDGSNSGSSAGMTWQYVSKDGGKSWHYDTTIGGS